MMMLLLGLTTFLSQAYLTMYRHLPLQHQMSKMPPVEVVKQHHLLQLHRLEDPIDWLVCYGSHHIGHKACVSHGLHSETSFDQ